MAAHVVRAETEYLQAEELVKHRKASPSLNNGTIVTLG